MRKLLLNNKQFIITYLLLLALGLVLKLIYTKEELFLAVNLNHSSFADVFFTLMTYVGDGIMFIAFSLILLFVEYRKAVLSAIVYLVSSQIAQILKRLVFADYPRPKKYFEGIQELHFVDGVEVHNMMSFPSGHTTSAFALAAVICLMLVNKNWSYLLLLMAAFIGYSRMYLAQHFFEDVLMGSLIGVFSAFLVQYILNTTTWYHSKKLNKSLLKRN